ncbi:MAG: hypothetical protein AB8G11_18205 [Saprospiraceae bacterium]
MDNIERNTNYIYKLYCKPLGLLNIQEPKGYENDTRSYNRDKDSRGFTIKTDIDLEFFGNGADYLYNLVQMYGINEKCTLTKYERDNRSLSESFKLRYIQEIDLGTLKRDDRTGMVTVNATTGGLYDDIKNRESDEYNLINELSADNEEIGKIRTVPFSPKPRSLFLETFFKTERSQYTVHSVRGLDSSDIRESRTIPLKTEYISGDRFQLPYYSDESMDGRNTSESINIGEKEDTGNIFFWRSDVDRDLKVNIDLRYTIQSNSKFDDVTNTNFKLNFKISEADEENLYDNIVDIIPVQSFDPRQNLGVEKVVQGEYLITIKKGQSVSLTFDIFGENTLNGGFFGDDASIVLYIDIPVSSLKIEDTADYAPTNSRAMKPLDFFNRIVQKITGKDNLVVSSILEDGGEYGNILVDNGFWARGFRDEYEDSNGEKQTIQMKTSFKDAFESFNYLEPLCWFTFFDGNTEKIRIEKAKYTQQNFIGLNLGSVDKIESEISKLDFFSSISIGHSQNMDYEEISGLDEPNGLSELSTFITKTKSKYSVVSKIRTDATGYELIRRKNYEEYPKEDTTRDSELWMHDTKRLSNGYYTHLLWNDTINGVSVLDEAPKGVFKSENFWNFRLSPMNRLYYGHAYSIKRGLYHYPNKFINFNSSNANQNLITLSNGVELKENSFLAIKDLEKPRVEPEKISFTFKMTQDIEDKLLSFKRVNNLSVPNYFGLIKYLNKGEEQYGRLIKIESSDETKITIIKARL